MIQAVELTKRFNGTTAVDQISFAVGAGKTLGLIGTSGCGKTTTLRMLNRLIEPTSGCVLIDGKNIARQPPESLRRGIGYVIQSIGLFPHYTVADNVAIVPRLLKRDERRISERIAELLDLVGLPPERFSSRYPHELSGGQQQRVGFARALAADPPIILLDEPFGGLDQITRGQIQQDFRRLKQQLGKTVVLVTHDVFEAVYLCDELCLMDAGKVRQFGTPSDLIFRPANAFVSDFFSSQRFLASLQVVRLRDLVPHLRASASQLPPKADSSVILNTSLLDILQQLSGLASGELEFSVSDENGSRLFRAGIANLLGAFEKVRTEISGDGMAK